LTFFVAIISYKAYPKLARIFTE